MKKEEDIKKCLVDFFYKNAIFKEEGKLIVLLFLEINNAFLEIKSSCFYKRSCEYVHICIFVAFSSSFSQLLGR